MGDTAGSSRSAPRGDDAQSGFDAVMPPGRGRGLHHVTPDSDPLSRAKRTCRYLNERYRDGKDAEGTDDDFLYVVIKTFERRGFEVAVAYGLSDDAGHVMGELMHLHDEDGNYLGVLLGEYGSEEDGDPATVQLLRPAG